MKGKTLLGIALVLGVMTAIVTLTLWLIGRELPGISATPTPTPCVPQEATDITCTLSASATKVKVGDIVTFRLDVFNPAGSCRAIGWFSYYLNYPPKLLSAESFVGRGDYEVFQQSGKHFAGRTVPHSLSETFELEAVQAGEGTVGGSIGFEEHTDFGASWRGCDAGYLDVLVEP